MGVYRMNDGAHAYSSMLEIWLGYHNAHLCTHITIIQPPKRQHSTKRSNVIKLAMAETKAERMLWNFGEKNGRLHSI